MSLQRRNTVTPHDAQRIALIALVAGGLGALAGVSPTGETSIDVVLSTVTAALVTWLAATAPWWALLVGAGLALAGSFAGPWWITAIAAGALLAAAWIGWTKANHPLVRAAVGAAIVQVAFRIEWNPFFLSSAGLAAAAMGVVAVTGLLRRPAYLRRRVWWPLVGVAAFSLVAIGGLSFAAYQARTTAQDGYTGMLDGLEQVESGDTAEASATLMQAATDLAAAGDDLDSVLAQPARLIPGLAQNRNSAVALVDRASDAAESAANALAVVDLDRLTVSDGRVDLYALTDLEAPLAELEVSVGDLRDTLDGAASPWLVAPFQDRLARVTRRADQAARQSEATAATARIAPDMLGADGPRRYFVAFVNPAEARGQGGLMGNWSEITADGGRIRVTGNGRTAELQDESLRDLQLDASADFLARYGSYGAEIGGGVSPRYWSNVTLPADMPSVGSPMAQMYEQATGRAVDGAFVIDPVGLGALVDVAGSIEIDALDRSFSGDELRDYLLLDQYEIEEAEREAVLEEITEAAITQLFSGQLPPPQELVSSLSSAVLDGHITGWAKRPDEQRLLELAGMDGSLPVPTDPGMDALAVVSSNASGNKIENFLERTIDYQPVVDQQTGDVTATLTLTLTNNAPTSGYDTYVIGNIVDAPIGTNRMLLDVYTRLDVVDVRLDGDPRIALTMPELGYQVYRHLFDIAPGDTVVFEFQLSGNVGPGSYSLAYRPQPLPNPDTLTFDAQTAGGDEIFTFDGTLTRRSVISADGVDAWWQPASRSNAAAERVRRLQLRHDRSR